MQSAMVSIPLGEFQELQQAKEKAERETAELREQIRQAKIQASDATLLAAARAGVEIARFAVANLPAESTSGWPFESLRTLGIAIVSFPDATTDDGDLSNVFISYARECEPFEVSRRARAKRVLTAID